MYVDGFSESDFTAVVDWSYFKHVGWIRIWLGGGLLSNLDKNETDPT